TSNLFFNPEGDDCSPDDDDPDSDSDSSHSDRLSSSDERDSESDHEEINEPLNSPLYNGSPITIGESILSLLMLVIRHKISHVLLTDIIKIISLHCPIPNFFPRTLYKFRKFFSEFGLPIRRHYFCSICFSKLENSTSNIEKCKDAKQCYFIELPLIAQLLRLFKREGFYNLLNTRFDRQHDPLKIKVIFGMVKFIKILVLRINFYQTAITSLSRGIRMELIYINHPNSLSFSLRSQLKNVLIAGFWFGPTKPKANVFMNSFRQRIENIYSGIFVRIPNHPNAIKVRGMIICGTCDLPAKTCFLNMKGHNGIYGCCKCKIKSQKEGKTRVFPYEEQMNPRATEETVQQGERAFETGESVEGVKGPTTLSKIVLDFIDTTSIDSMHCVFLGIVKQLMRLWLDSKFHKSTFSLRGHINYINQTIKNINPPSFTHRLPRSVSDFKYWKASEMKYWLLYYS
ncbi:Protein of unknown function, partial [Cotesia congregata]